MSSGVELIDSVEGFEQEVTQANRPVLACFAAEWCPACRLMTQILGEFAAKYGERIRVMKSDITHSPAETALAIREKWLWPHGASWSISTIPTTILFVNGKPERTWYGAIPLQQLVVDMGAWL